MAEPTAFPQANMQWTGWEGDGEKPDVGNLPSYRNGDESISCWRLTWSRRQ